MSHVAKFDQFAPGDVVTVLDGSARIWHKDTVDLISSANTLPVAMMKEGDRALVICVNERHLFVLYEGVIGYVFSTRICKVF